MTKRRRPSWRDPFLADDKIEDTRRSAQDINDINRTLIGGAVTIGTLGLIGSLFRK